MIDITEQEFIFWCQEYVPDILLVCDKCANLYYFNCFKCNPLYYYNLFKLEESELNETD